jgi:ABC-type Fe3+-hydroxamate transport system substrate-binding protein
VRRNTPEKEEADKCMLHCTDGLGQKLTLEKPASRIVSLVPSQTEWLAYLGLDKELVGITKFCVHPGKWIKQKEIIGGTKNVSRDRIRRLNPELIVGNKEENTQAVMEDLMEEFPCYISDVTTIEDAWSMMHDLGYLAGRQDQADSFIGHLKCMASQSFVKRKADHKLRIAYVIWDAPIMVAGSNTYINSIIEHYGGINVFASMDRYPVVDSDVWEQTEIDLVLLSSEPFPFEEEHRSKYISLAPEADVLLVNGELFSWYGWRMVKTFSILPEILGKS